jgi:hypothetical protein
LTGELEKVDFIRMRMGVSYKEARRALEAAGGDVTRALIRLEDKTGNMGERLRDRRADLTNSLRGMVRKSHATRVRLMDGDRSVAEAPGSVVAAGLIGTLLSNEIALLMVAGAVMAMTRGYTLEVDWPEGEDEMIRNTSYAEPGVTH